MTYSPSTLRFIDGDIGGGAPRFWAYTSADGDGTITGSNYFSDGDKKGMKVGDIVDVINTTGPKYKRYQVTGVTAGSGATVAAPTAIT